MSSKAKAPSCVAQVPQRAVLHACSEGGESILTPPDLVDYIVWLYDDRGERSYGSEAVTQLEHALQCAELAEREGAHEALIAASLLHDIGHLLPKLGAEVARGGVDDRHEYLPLRMLRRHFGEAVLAPIRLHVAAKRYLCAVQPGYCDGLSSASRMSLQRQGGIYTQAEAARFMREPYADDAIRLRQWDDRAKVRGKVTPDFPYYVNLLLRCAQEHQEPQSQT